MPVVSRTQHSLFAVVLSLCLGDAFSQAQPAPSTYEPSVGQQGKDVVWVPTPQALVDKMLDMAKVTTRDYVIDLGSGDGRTVITAAKRGVRALGIEYNPDMVELSKRNAEKEGVSDRATFVKADLFESDFSKASVITMFLLPDINLKLRPKILDLKAGTRIVSNTFTMGEWSSDQSVSADEKEGCQSYCVAHLWIVPAKVAGTWKLPQGVVSLTQEFQMLSGKLTLDQKVIPITSGRVRGDELTFTAGGTEYSGRMNGRSIQGTSKASLGTWTRTPVNKPVSPAPAKA